MPRAATKFANNLGMVDAGSISSITPDLLR
jgi:hypothetical protein